MSTIASPREPPIRRMPPSSQTPTPSNRASLETSRSLSISPSRGPSSGAGAGTDAGAVRRNRAALREYYNLKKTGQTPTLEVTEAFDGGNSSNGATDPFSYSEVPGSAMDAPDFNAETFVQRTLQESSLEELLRVYTRVLGESRALDAEKKSLVYDNYSRLIAATETIRKMRATMDPLNPMASTLDPAIAHIYNQASSLRDALRSAVPPPDSEAAQQAAARARTRELAAAVLQTPNKLRRLVSAGRTEEAEQAWERPRRLLETWRDRGVGGADEVAACLADGDAALRGEPSPEGWTAGTP